MFFQLTLEIKRRDFCIFFIKKDQMTCILFKRLGFIDFNILISGYHICPLTTMIKTYSMNYLSTMSRMRAILKVIKATTRIMQDQKIFQS